ncbi:Yip1 domain-containing protein [Cribrihabitans marinus]|uniref:Yip1 domain-containing protein n=1 Tax=Cribrihabitans marinus TaxID=1227549 RepID=A0A1H6WCW7_9RHOB|nr:YIP1 family protein [Cribrihabitans marinus]GGH24193.1 hypothetical protein GCM10010973_10570 [Cribrihabitans marinus]SEJ14869.1 Yip1 domain-containing protein [Cribrihabitans marinus]
MITADWRALAVLTVKDPAEAARRVLALNLPAEVCWLGLALAVVLDTLLYIVSNMALPPVESPFYGLIATPVGYGAVVGGGLVVTIIAIHRVGRVFGGEGGFGEILSLMVWLQLLSVVAQAAVFVLVLVVPLLAMILSFAATFLGIYIFLHFVDQAHRLGSLWRAAGVLVAAVLAISLAFMILLSLIGAPLSGTLQNV